MIYDKKALFMSATHNAYQLTMIINCFRSDIIVRITLVYAGIYELFLLREDNRTTVYSYPQRPDGVYVLVYRYLSSRYAHYGEGVAGGCRINDYRFFDWLLSGTAHLGADQRSLRSSPSSNNRHGVIYYRFRRMRTFY